MKVRQNGVTYQTTTFSSKHTSPSLAERVNGETKYTPLVTSDGEVEIEGTTYSYDSSAYPKIAARFGGVTYYAINKDSVVGVKPVAYQPTATATFTLYSNNPNLTIGTSRKSWNANVRQTALGKTVKPMLITGGSNWTPDETYCEKITTTDNVQIVPLIKATDYIGFTFADITVVPDGDTETERALKLTWIHMSTKTNSPITFVATIWHGGECDFVVKVDPINNKAYYGGDISSSPHTPTWQEIPYNFNFQKDVNGWYDINIPISIVLDSISVSNKMYALTFIPDSNTSYDNNYYIDNLYLYEAPKSKEQLKATLLLEIVEAQKVLDEAEIGTDPGQYPQSAADTLQAAITSSTNVYNDDSATPEEIVNSATSLAASIETFKNSQISDLMPEVVTKDYIATLGNSTANYTSETTYGASASATNELQAARFAIDGSITTRWETVASDPQSITIDMKQSRTWDRIAIAWETACGKRYSFSYSDDGETWQTIGTEADNSTGKLNLMYHTTPKTSRYIRLNGISRYTDYGYSIYEFVVSNSEDENFTPYE